ADIGASDAPPPAPPSAEPPSPEPPVEPPPVASPPVAPSPAVPLVLVAVAPPAPPRPGRGELTPPSQAAQKRTRTRAIAGCPRSGLRVESSGLSCLMAREDWSDAPGALCGSC